MTICFIPLFLPLLPGLRERAEHAQVLYVSCRRLKTLVEY